MRIILKSNTPDMEIIADIQLKDGATTDMWINGKAVTPSVMTIVIPPRHIDKPTEPQKEEPPAKALDQVEMPNDSCTDVSDDIVTSSKENPLHAKLKEVRLPIYKNFPPTWAEAVATDKTAGDMLFTHVKRWAITNPGRSDYLVKVVKEILTDEVIDEYNKYAPGEPTMSNMMQVMHMAQRDGCISIIRKCPIRSFNVRIKSNIKISPIERLYADQRNDDQDVLPDTLDETSFDMDPTTDPISTVRQMIYSNILDWIRDNPGQQTGITNLFNTVVSTDMRDALKYGIDYTISERDVAYVIPLLITNGWATAHRDYTGSLIITSMASQHE